MNHYFSMMNPYFDKFVVVVFAEEMKSKQVVVKKEEDSGELPEDFILEDEANSDDLWSAEAKAKYGTKPKEGDEAEWDKWVMGGLPPEPDRRYDH